MRSKRHEQKRGGSYVETSYITSEDKGQGPERVTAYVEGRVTSTDMKLLQPSKEQSRLEVLW